MRTEFLSNFFFSLTFFMLLSELIETRTALGARVSIESLIKLTPTKANLIESDGVEKEVKMAEAIEKLNRQQYQASWEASPTGPRLILRNCPYAVILEKHPELCCMDEALISKLLDQPVQQTAKLERQPDGAPHCAFVTLAKS